MYEHTDRSLCNQLILVLTQKKKNFLVSQKSTTVKQTKEKYGKTLGLSKKVQQRNSQRNNKTTWQSKPQLWQSNRKQLNINVSVPLLCFGVFALLLMQHLVGAERRELEFLHFF